MFVWVGEGFLLLGELSRYTELLVHESEFFPALGDILAKLRVLLLQLRDLLVHVGQHHELSAKHLVLALQLLDLKLEVDRLLLEDLDECLVARDGAKSSICCSCIFSYWKSR